MTHYKILWMDDDINQPELRPNLVSLRRKECEIIPIDNPDSFLDFIFTKSNEDEKIDCIIMDLSLPVGNKINVKESKFGTSTGLLLLAELEKTSFKDILSIVYTITDNDEAKKYCRRKGIEYWSKIDFLSDDFAENVISLISEKRKNEQ